MIRLPVPLHTRLTQVRTTTNQLDALMMMSTKKWAAYRLPVSRVIVIVIGHRSSSKVSREMNTDYRYDSRSGNFPLTHDLSHFPVSVTIYLL